jgi:hypothetical protein
MLDQDTFAFSHADKGMTRFPPNIEQISVENESLWTWLIVRRNDVKLRFPLCNAVYADYLYQLAAYGLLWNENYPDHPPVGGFHLCRFAKEQGDFSHHYFPSLDDEAASLWRPMRKVANTWLASPKA